MFYCGIDWSEALHDVAVIDGAGIVVTHGRHPETPEGVKDLLRMLSGLSSSHRHSRRKVRVAIETRHGLLVRALRDDGMDVVAINPAVVARYRGRMNPARTKSDRTDAALLANILRTDGHVHRSLPYPSPESEAITVLARSQGKAVRDQQFYLRRLRSLLREFFPAAITAWHGEYQRLLRVEARALLAAAPTPTAAARLRRPAIARILDGAGRTRHVAEHADRLWEVFHIPQLRQPQVVEEAMGAQMLAALASLDQACAAADDLAGRLDVLYQAHPLAPVLSSFPGIGLLLGARLLGEIGDDPARFATARDLRAYSGVAPLTWASGGSHQVRSRRVANLTLKGTCHLWAFCSLTCSPGCRALYDRRKDAGDKHPAALRHLAYRLLGALHHCLTTGVLYREDIAYPALAVQDAEPRPDPGDGPVVASVAAGVP